MYNGQKGPTHFPSDPQKYLKESSIMVAVRVRPFTPSEKLNLVDIEDRNILVGDGSFSKPEEPLFADLKPKGIRKVVEVVDDRMLIFDPPDTNPISQMQKRVFYNSCLNIRYKEHRFVFDRLFDQETSQEDIYSITAKPLLESVLNGFNATVFAYGATGCGKTYTISGTPDNPGLIFLTMKELFEKIENKSDTKVFELSISYLEIYNETIRDLLCPSTDHKKLILREDAKQRISVSNLSTHKPKTVEEVMDLILFGNNNRTSSPTEANATSSRSHAVLQINILSRDKSVDLNEEHTYATLSIIDLAGSERAAATKNRGIRLNEGANINKSLLSLGNCINALCDPRRKNHVPYRNSKLTRLLKFSLGGNCKTVMIVCVSPSSKHYDETLNTLKYANRAKEIKTKVRKNSRNLDRHVGSYLKMITEQKIEIEELKNKQERLVHSTIEHQKTLSQRCLHETLSKIDSFSVSLFNDKNARWKRYSILTKRKVYLIQKADLERIALFFEKDSNKDSTADNYETLSNTINEILAIINSEIESLEHEYSRIKTFLNENSGFTEQILNGLKEIDGWQEYNTIMFKFLVNSLNESMEKDTILKSSVLFDHIVYEIGNFNLMLDSTFSFLKQFNHANSLDLASCYYDQIDTISNHLANFLNKLKNGNYSTYLENIAIEFFKKSETDIGNTSKNEVSSSKKEAHRYNYLKRAPNSPLKSTSSHDRKKHFKKEGDSSLVSADKITKKVHWNVSPYAAFESDLSMDDSQIMSTRCEIDGDSSGGDNTIDRSDELDLSFNPVLNSPPVLKIVETDGFPTRASQSNDKLKPQRASLTNIKLPTIQKKNTKFESLNKKNSSKLDATADILKSKDHNQH